MTQPAAVFGDGNLHLVFVPAGGIASVTAPTATELNAGTALDITPYLTGDGYTPSTDQSATTDERLHSKQTYERPGRFTDKIDVRYVYRQQEPTAADNKAYTTLRQDVEGYIVSRWGKAYTTAIAAGDIVDVYPIQCGVQMKQPKESNATLKVAQHLYVTAAANRDVTVA